MIETDSQKLYCVAYLIVDINQTNYMSLIVDDCYDVDNYLISHIYLMLYNLFDL